MTYGEIRLRLSQMLPGIDLELVDGWIADRYQQILDRLSWQRRDVRSTIQTVAPISAGTIALTEASTTVTGTGTGWTSAITGCGLWVAGRNEFYEATYASGTGLTLDRPYEGSTASGIAYKLYTSVYVLPADCRILGTVKSLQHGPLAQWTGDQVGVTFGAPLTYRLFMDSADPPVQQIELTPAPDAAYGLAIEYTAEETTFTAAATSVSLLPWVRPGALVAGVHADGLSYLEKFAAADRQEARFEALLGDMVRTETRRTPPKTIKVSSKFAPSRWSNARTRTVRERMPGAWNDQA